MVVEREPRSGNREQGVFCLPISTSDLGRVNKSTASVGKGGLEGFVIRREPGFSESQKLEGVRKKRFIMKTIIVLWQLIQCYASV